MNFFNAKIAKDDGKLYVEGNELHLQIPEDRVNVYMPYAGKEVIFGIRPEDIHNPAFVPADIYAQNVNAKVDITELMGNEIFVFLKTGNSDYVARVDPRSRYGIADDVQVVFNMANMHIFDKDTEVAIR
jgi:multiple sugar transport system ATP-binding protein